jgi:hypothetical protein
MPPVSRGVSASPRRTPPAATSRLSAACPQCGANGRIPRAVQSARQQQVGEIGASNQQQQSGHRDQYQQRLPPLFLQLVQALRSGKQLGVFTFQLLHFSTIGDLELGDGFSYVGSEKGLQRGRGLLARQARGKTSEDRQPMGIARAERFRPSRFEQAARRHRQKEIRRVTAVDATKTFRSDADDRKKTAVKGQRLADDRRLISEAPGPEVIREHRDWIGFAGDIVGWGEQPSGSRVHAENVKKVPGYQLRIRAVRLAMGFQLNTVSNAHCKPLKPFGVVPQT